MVVASHSLSALQYAASELRSDRSLVLEAVKVNGRALEYASDDLKAEYPLKWAL